MSSTRLRRWPHAANESGARAAAILDRLAAAGVRITEQRAQVVRAIAERRTPLAPELLVEQLRSLGVGRATVYRTLERMERLGMLARVNVGTSRGYTVCDGDEGHHHHIICSVCRTVVPIDAISIELEIRRLAEQLHFEVETHTLEFERRCAACRRAAVS